MSVQSHEHDQGEQYFSPRDIFEHFESVGSQTEDRYAADVLGLTEYEHFQLPERGIDGFVRLESGTTANIGWITSPVIGPRTDYLVVH